MEDAYDRIPKSLAGVDLEAVGNHRGWYESFTKHLDRLKCSVAYNEASSSHSPVNHNLLPCNCSIRKINCELHKIISYIYIYI